MELGSLQELGRWQLSCPLWDGTRALGVTHPVLSWQGCPEAAIGFSLYHHSSRDVLRASLQVALGKESTRKGSKGDVAAGATVRVLSPASMK